MPRAACPSFAISTPVSRSGMPSTFDRSAPAARMNGLPVMPTAAISFSAARAASPSSTPCSSSRVLGPRVFGRVWSRPLSRVMSASILPLGRVTSRTKECVTTSSGSSVTSLEKSGVVVAIYFAPL